MWFIGSDWWDTCTCWRAPFSSLCPWGLMRKAFALTFLLISYWFLCLLLIVVNLWQINPEKAREEFRDVSKKNGGTGVKDFMDGMGLGMLADQVKHLTKSFLSFHCLVKDQLQEIATHFLLFFFYIILLTLLSITNLQQCIFFLTKALCFRKSIQLLHCTFIFFSYQDTILWKFTH